MIPMKIGLCGPQHVGKSTTARYIRRALSPGDAYAMHALESCYEAVSQLLVVDREVLESADTKDVPWTYMNAPAPALAGFTPRNVVDFLAIQLREKFGMTIFNDLWHRAADNMRDAVIINHAIRYDFEAEGMDIVIELTRSGVDYDGSEFNRRISDQMIDIVWDLDSQDSEFRLANMVEFWLSRFRAGKPILVSMKDAL